MNELLSLRCSRGLVLQFSADGYYMDTMWILYSTAYYIANETITKLVELIREWYRLKWEPH